MGANFELVPVRKEGERVIRVSGEHLPTGWTRDHFVRDLFRESRENINRLVGRKLFYDFYDYRKQL